MIYLCSTSDIIITHMHPRILILALCLSCAFSLHFVISVPRNDGPKCFFQFLTVNEKYMFQVSSRTHYSYRMDVERSHDGANYEPVVAKQADSAIETVNKLADKAGTYRFCIVNKADDTLRAYINIMTGLELVNLDYLPDNNDQQNLHREIDWLERQKTSLFEALNRIEGVRVSSDELKNKMNTSYIIFAVLGLVGVVAMNYVFYTQTRKTLRDRKLI